MEPRGYHSFLVRLWCEMSGDGSEHWCGEVEHIQSGGVQRFSDIDALLEFLRPVWLSGQGTRAQLQQSRAMEGEDDGTRHITG